MLENYWYIACPSARLSHKPQRIEIFGKPVVLSRLEGEVVAFEDRCAHRNVALSGGKVCRGRLVCPYHGWEYDKTGRVTSIPALAAEATPKDICIPRHACAEQDGYIWICTGTPVTPAPPHLPHFGEKGWISFHERALFQAPVPQVLENFLDIPHAIYVHTFWFREPLYKKALAVVRTLPDGAEAEVRDEPRDKGVLWGLIGRTGATLRHTDRFIAPATSRIDYEFSDGRYYVVSSFCTPLDEHRTQVHTIVTFRAGVMGWIIRAALKPLAKLLIHQDVRITAEQQATIRTFGGTPRFRVTAADLLFPHIQIWRHAIKSGSETPAPGKEQAVEIYL